MENVNSDPAISIVIISYNTAEMTRDCIASVIAQTTMPFELIVLDNASQDGSAQMIAESFPIVKLIAEPINHGFGPAHKIAIQHATAPWLLLLNPDTVVLDHAIDKVFAFAQRSPSYGIWGGRTMYGDGSLNPTSCFAKMTLHSVLFRVLGLNGLFRRSKFFNAEYYGDWLRDTEREVDIVTGCFLLIRRDLWDRLDGFDDAFFMYGEEVDLCLRAQALGARPHITPDATIIHYGGASQAVRSDKIIRLLRAKIELIKRHFPAAQISLGCSLFRLWPLSRQWAYKVAVLVRPGERTQKNSQAWTEVWARRKEWWNGFEG
ncbi:MAG: glycosyltransferase family 2 protein [Candidatus Saccharibacteria bacterium]|nr:glycosyltransferase family 2 protein [Pseudorhodobacter sp.]